MSNREGQPMSEYHYTNNPHSRNNPYKATLTKVERGEANNTNMDTWHEGDVLWTCEGTLTGFSDEVPRPFTVKYVRRAPDNYDEQMPSRSIIRVKYAKGWSRSKDAPLIRRAVLDTWPRCISRAQFAD